MAQLSLSKVGGFNRLYNSSDWAIAMASDIHLMSELMAALRETKSLVLTLNSSGSVLVMSTLPRFFISPISGLTAFKITAEISLERFILSLQLYGNSSLNKINPYSWAKFEKRFNMVEIKHKAFLEW